MNWTHHIRDEFARLSKQVDETVAEELAQHADAAWQQVRANGQSAAAAEARVRALITAWCEGTSGPRRISRAPLVESAAAASSPFAGLGLDVRQALRLFTRQPGFAFMSVLMIALGIGVTTTLFSVVNGVLLRPLPWKTADRLVRVFENHIGIHAQTSWSDTLTSLTYNTWSEQPQTIDGVAGWRDGE